MSSARNSLICIGLTSEPCGLTAVLSAAEAERECENGEKTCRLAAEVARYEVRNNPRNPRKHAVVGKKSQPVRVGF
jgi:hypothetical protein